MSKTIENTTATPDEQALSQFIDGELATEQAGEIRRRLLSEPALRARYEQMNAANDRLKQALDVPGADNVPEQVSQMLAAADTGNTRQLSTIRRAGWGLAIAASIMATSGVLLNPLWQNHSDSRDAEIAGVLETSPSRATGWETLPGGDRLRPVLSFRSNAGQWCREYLLETSDNAWRGVACRDDRAWRTRVISEVGQPESAGEYRPAGATDSDSVAAFIDRHAADLPLSAREEAGIIDTEWR